MTRSKRAVVVLTLALAGPVGSARAQFFQPGGGGGAEKLEGFTVAGKGTAVARPNRLEIDLEVTSASELTADAIVKYRDAKKRLQEAFAALKLANVAVEERGLLVDQKGTTFNPYFMDSMPARRGKVEVQLTRKLVVTCTHIREMDEEALLQLVARLLDVAQDAGGRLGGQPQMNNYFYYRYGQQNTSGLVRFILDDFDAPREKAYQAAVADARARAGRLAKLSGVELGPVAGVREVVVPGDRALEGEEEVHPPRLESSRFQEMPIRVELLVRFDTAPAKARGRDGGP